MVKQRQIQRKNAKPKAGHIAHSPSAVLRQQRPIEAELTRAGIHLSEAERAAAVEAELAWLGTLYSDSPVTMPSRSPESRETF